MAIPALLAAVVQWILSTGASGVAGNRTDAALMRLVKGPDRDFVDRVARLASGAANVRVDRAAFGVWLADERTFSLLSRLAARPEASGTARFDEIAGEYASELLATAEQYAIAVSSHGQVASADTGELIACTLLALWTESDPSLRPLFVLLNDTGALLSGQEQLRAMTERLVEVMEKENGLAVPDDVARRSYITEVTAFLSRAPRWHPGSLDTLFLDRTVSPVMIGAPTGKARFGTVSWQSAARDLRIGGVIAPAGFGKTWALRALLADAAADPSGPLPVWVHAQTLATVGDSGLRVPELIGRLASLISRRLPAASINAITAHDLTADGVILAVDALDEVHDPALRNRANEAIADLAAGFRGGDCRGQFFFSSRPAGFENPIDDFGRKRDGTEVLVELVPLQLTEVEGFFDRWCELRESSRARNRLRKLTRPGSPLRQAVTVPLLASLCAWVAENDDVAETKAGVFSQVVDRFLERRWKQGEAQSPLGQRIDDPAWRQLVRRSLGRLAEAMATSSVGWQEQASPTWCERVLQESGCPEGPRGRTRTWSMCFEVGALTPIGLAEDAVDVPVGWIHRSIQQFLVAERLASISGGAADGTHSASEFLAARCDSPEWTDVAVFLAGQRRPEETDGQPGEALLKALCERAIDGHDPFGLLSELIAAIALEIPAVALPPEGQRYLARQLAAGIARPSAVVPALRDHAAEPLNTLIAAGVLDPELYEALLTLGQDGRQMLEELAATQPGADGAVAIIAQADQAAAVRALIRRADSGIGVSSQDARVLRHASDAPRAKMLAAYENQPHNLARADLAAAAATEGTLESFVSHVADPDPQCRVAALNGIATLLSFDVPRTVAAKVRTIADTDPDPDIRVLARNIVDTWEIGSPAALQSKPPQAPAALGAQYDAVELLTRSLTSAGALEVGAALQLCVQRPELQGLPGVAGLIDNLESRVRAGQFDWRWVDSLARIRPQLAEVLVGHVRRGDRKAVRNAALAIPYLNAIPAAERLDALAAAIGRLDERWSAASFQVLADKHPMAAVEAACRVLESGQRPGPAGIRRLVTAGRYALYLLEPRERTGILPRIAMATATVTRAIP